MEKIFKRDNGDRVKIVVIVNEFMKDVFRVNVLYSPKGKHKFQNVIEDTHEYRQMNVSQRDAYRRKKCLEYVTVEEIDSVKEAYLEYMRTKWEYLF